MKFKNQTIQKWTTLLAVALTGGVINKICYLRETYYTPLQQATGATDIQLGLLMSAFGIANFIFYFPGGVLADKFSPKKLIVFSCFATAAAGFWYATLPPFEILMFLHVIFAITTVFTFWAAMIKIVNNLGGPEEQGRLIGSLEASRGLFGTIAAFISIYFFAKAGEGVAGLQATVRYYSIVLILAGVIAAIFIQEPEMIKEAKTKKEKITKKDVLEVIKIPQIWLAGVLVLMSYSALIFHGMITPYLSEAFGLSGSVVAILSTVRTYVMMMIGAVAAGILADKLGSVIKLMKYGFIGLAIFAFGYLIIPANRDLIWVIVLNFVFYGLCLYSVKALYFATIDEVMVPKRLAGTASGIISLIGYAPEMFMYVWVGKIVSSGTGLSGYHTIFKFMIGFGVVGFLCAMLLLKLNTKARIKAGLITG
jgi:MFS family permease